MKTIETILPKRIVSGENSLAYLKNLKGKRASVIISGTFTRVNFNNTVFDECRFLRVVFESCNMVKAYMGTRWGNKDFPKQDKFYLNN